MEIAHRLKYYYLKVWNYNIKVLIIAIFTRGRWL